MRKIISILQPFDAEQTVIAYEDGNKIDAKKISTPNFAEEICAFALANDIHEINLGGAKQYGKGLAKQIMEKNLTHFNLDPLDVNLI